MNEPSQRTHEQQARAEILASMGQRIERLAMIIEDTAEKVTQLLIQAKDTPKK